MRHGSDGCGKLQHRGDRYRIGGCCGIVGLSRHRRGGVCLRSVRIEARFATSRAAENDHDLAALNVERGIVEQNAAAIAHSQMAHADGGDHRSILRRNRRNLAGEFQYYPLQLVMMVKKPSITTIMTILVTTVLVVDRPTDVAPAPVARPRWQPIAAIVSPNTMAFMRVRCLAT